MDGVPSGLTIFFWAFSLIALFTVAVKLPAIIRNTRNGATKFVAPFSSLPQQHIMTSVASDKQLQIDNIAPLEQWLDRVNNHPDKVPHIAATGATGSGKTTLVTAILATRNDKVLVCTPKPDDDWGGIPIVTIDDDLSFTSIQLVARAIDKEIKQRWLNVKNAKRQGQQYTPEWLTIVIDDFPFLRKQIEGLSDTVLNIARMGRSMRVRLILLAQEATVKAWGFEGEGEARENFVFMDLPEAHWNDGGALMFRWGKPKEIIDTSGIWRLSRMLISPGRFFDVPAISSVCLQSDTSNMASQPQTDRQTATDRQQTITADDKEALVVALIRDGKGRDDVRNILKRLGVGLDNNEYTEYGKKARNN